MMGLLYDLYKLVTKRVIPLTCKKCGNRWEYGGNSTYFTACSRCKTSVSIRKQLQLDATLEDEPEIGRLRDFIPKSNAAHKNPK